MNKREWGVIATAVATVVTALLGSLYGLGEHAPGVIGGLLISAPAWTLVVFLVRQLEQARCDTLTTLRETGAFMQKLTTALDLMRERDSLSDELAEMRAAAKEVRDAKTDRASQG